MNGFAQHEVTETRNGFLGKTYVRTSHVVTYKGVEINRFCTKEAAERCVEDCVSIREDSAWAYEESMREAGYKI